MAADPGPLRWAWSKSNLPAGEDNLELIKYDDTGLIGTLALTYNRANSGANFVGPVTAPAVNVGANPVIASATAGNALTFDGTGFFVPPSSVSVPTVIPDTATISSTEAPVGTFTLAVALSATAGNVLVANADGLFVPTPAAAAATVLIGSEGVTVAELPVGTWTLGLTASATAGNVLTVNPDGLFVPTPTAVPTVITDTPTIDATELPVGTFALAAKISPALTSPGNMLTAAADGLAVLPTAIPISADPGNLLELRADGLYVRAVGLVFGMP